MGLLSFFPWRRHRHTSTPTPLHTSLYTRSIKTCPESSTPTTSKLHREIPLYLRSSKMLWEKPRFSRGWEVIACKEKKAKGLGAFTSLCGRKTLARNLPIKQRGLGILQILGCPAAYFQMCLHLPVFPVSQTGMEGPTPWPHPTLGSTPERGPVASNLSFGGLRYHLGSI